METNYFWQANFWGIVGTITGIIGLLISWANWHYSKPKIEIAKLKLKTPSPIFIESLTQRSAEQLTHTFIDYKLNIILRNRRGGSGSIEKPSLVINIPEEKSFLNIFKNYKKIKISPITESTKQRKLESSNAYETYEIETIRHGEAWNFDGGHTIDDELEYFVEDKKNIEEIIKNYSRLQYSIEYSNNFGKKFRKKIDQVIKETY